MFILMTAVFVYLRYCSRIKDLLCGHKTVKIKTVQKINIRLIITYSILI